MLINDIIVETVTVYYKTADKIAKNKVEPILWDTL